jgi:hypothetical protein
VGPARMFAESLTPRPGIREHNRHETDPMADIRPLSGEKRTLAIAHPRYFRTHSPVAAVPPPRLRAFKTETNGQMIGKSSPRLINQQD